MLQHQSLRSRFLYPRSVVFIGVPRKSGPGALNPVDNLKNWGYEGQVSIVHPHVREIAGIPVLSSVSELTVTCRSCSDFHSEEKPLRKLSGSAARNLSELPSLRARVLPNRILGAKSCKEKCSRKLPSSEFASSAPTHWGFTMRFIALIRRSCRSHVKKLR